MRLPSTLATLTIIALANSFLTAEEVPIVDKEGKAYPAPAELAKQAGDAVKGQVIFFSNGACSTCHQIDNNGIDFGPNLSEIGSRKTKELIIESILYPSKVIEAGFEMLKLKLESDEIAVGIFASETETDLVLKSAGGTKSTYKKTAIVSRSKEATSVMAAMGPFLSASDVADIAEYLSAQKKK